MHINISSIHCSIIGNHGNNQVVAWSAGRIAGTPLLEFPAIRNVNLQELAAQVSRKAYDIIDYKGATYYGIGACVATLCKSILHDSHHVFPITCWSEEHQAYVCLPAVLGRQGVAQVVSVSLSDAEQKQFLQTVCELKSILQSDKAQQDKSI